MSLDTDMDSRVLRRSVDRFIHKQKERKKEGRSIWSVNKSVIWSVGHWSVSRRRGPASPSVKKGSLLIDRNLQHGDDEDDEEDDEDEYEDEDDE